MKFDTMIVVIVSNYMGSDVFMTHPAMTPFDLGVLRPSMRSKLMSNEQIGIKKNQKMVTCDLWIARKFQFCKSIFSKFWKIIELEMKILINFSTPKNSNITFLDRSRNTQKSRRSFSFKPPIRLYSIDSSIRTRLFVYYFRKSFFWLKKCI